MIFKYIDVLYHNILARVKYQAAHLAGSLYMIETYIEFHATCEYATMVPEGLGSGCLAPSGQWFECPD